MTHPNPEQDATGAASVDHDALPFDVPQPDVVPIDAQAPTYPWHQRIKPYGKFLIALAGAIATAGVASFADSPDAVRWFQFVGGIATGLAVYAVPNKAPDGI
jgi:hypothetical protein